MTRELRLISVCRSFPTPDDPSAGVFVLNRVAAMADKADVKVLQPLPYFPGFKPLSGWARERSHVVGGIEIEHAPMLYFPGALKFLDARWLELAIQGRIKQIQREQPVDLIDAHFGYPDGVGCVRVAKRLGIPVFVTIRGFEKEFVNRPVIGPQMLDALRSATGVIAVSDSLKTFAVQNGISPDKVTVIHNAVDSTTFHPADGRAARLRLGIDVSVPLVVSVGHLIFRKRHHVLIDAFRQLRDELPNARLVIIGASSSEPEYPQALHRRADDLGLSKYITFAGNLPPAEVADWLRAADIFALATAREGCCNSVLEALGVGLPVVTTTVGDNAVFVKPGFNGDLVPVDDVSALAGAMGRALGRADWGRDQIAADLHAQIGGWPDVADRVLSRFSETVEV